MTPEEAKKKGFREKRGKGIITWRILPDGSCDKRARYVHDYIELRSFRDSPTKHEMEKRIINRRNGILSDSKRNARVNQYYENGWRVKPEHINDLREEMVLYVNWHNPNDIALFTITNSNKIVLENAVKKGWAFYSFKGATIAAEEENRIERIKDRRANHHEPMTEEQAKDLRGETYYVLGARGQVEATTTIDIRAIREGRAFWNGKDAHKKTTEEGRNITQDLIFFINEFEKKSGSKAKYLLLSGFQRNKLSGELHNKSLVVPDSIEIPYRDQFMGIPIVLSQEICDARSLNQ